MGIPERLVEIREKNGYTRKRLAEELGRPYTTITKYETGEREAGHEYIKEIALKFGVTTDYILGIEDETKKSSALSENNAEENAEDDSKSLLLKELDNLTQEDRKNLLDYVHFLASKRNSKED